MASVVQRSNGEAVQLPKAVQFSNSRAAGVQFHSMRSPLTPDHKIALPEAVIRQLDLRVGMPFQIFVDGNQITLQPLNDAYFATLRGVLIGEGLSAETVREDKLAQRAFEEQKLDRTLPSKP